MIRLLIKKKLLIITFLFSIGVFCGVYTAQAAVPTKSIGFQGQLSNGGSAVNATVAATFEFYDAVSGGTLQGSMISKSVNVVNGYFSTSFSEADLVGIDFNQALWVQVTIEGNILAPRSTINTVPFAINSFGLFAYASAPTVGPAGSLYYNTVGNKIFSSDGVSWIDTTGGTTTLAVAQNALVVGNASSTNGEVAPGSVGQILVVNASGTPAWSSGLTVLANGNVGIGTTTPDAKLQLTGGIGTALKLNNTSSPTRANFFLSAGITGYAHDASAFYENYDGVDVYHMATYQKSLFLGGRNNVVSNAAVTILNGQSKSEIFRIDSTSPVTVLNGGNVGIGTTSPVSALAISGAFGAIDSSGFAPLFIRNTSGSAGFQLQGSSGDSWKFVTGGSAFAVLNSTDTQYRLNVPNDGSGLWVGASGSFTNPGDNVIFANTGNVGIGTTSPTAKLDILDTTLAGSGSLAGSALNIAQTWNTTGTPTALKLSVTDTASGAFSATRLMDVVYNGTSYLNILKDGQARFSGLITVNGLLNNGTAYLRSTLPSINFGSSDQTSLRLEDTHVYAFRGTTNAQSLRIYNTYTDPANYERAGLNWSGNTLNIGTENGGTGIARNLAFMTGSTTRMTIDTSGNVGIGTANPTSALHVAGDIYSPGVTTLTVGYVRPTYWVGSSNYYGSTPSSSFSLGQSGTTPTINIYASSTIFSGNLGIGTTTPIFPLDVYASTTSNQTYGYLNSAGEIGTSAGTNAYSIRAQGRILAQEFNAVSDARLKNVQFELDSKLALSLITKLQPVSFTWKTQPDGQPVIGFLAQDVETVIPNAVSKIPTDQFPDQRELDYNQVTTVLVGAFKEIAQAVENIGKWFVGGKFNIQDDVCVDDVCLTKDEFKTMLLKSKSEHNTPAPSNNPAVVVPPAEDPAPESEPVPEPTPEPTPEPAPEPEPAPAPVVDTPTE